MGNLYDVSIEREETMKNKSVETDVNTSDSDNTIMEFELNNIYCGDCLELLKQMKDNSIDVIITSPPYNKAGYEGFIRKRHKKDNWIKRNIDYDDNELNDFMEEQKYQNWQIEVLNECFRVLKDDGSLFYNHKIRMAKHKSSHPLEWCLKTNLIFRQQIIWDRGSSPSVSPIRFVPSTELILWFTKKRQQPNFKRNINATHKTEVIRINASKDSEHPASFPVELVDAILCNIDNKDGNAVVLDIFNGIGKTCVSAKNNGFSYIGIDKCEKYCNIARLKLENLS